MTNLVYLEYRHLELDEPCINVIAKTTSYTTDCDELIKVEFLETRKSRLGLENASATELGPRVSESQQHAMSHTQSPCPPSMPPSTPSRALL